MKEDNTVGKTYHIDALEELISLKWSYYPRQSADSMQSKISMPFFIELEETILNLYETMKDKSHSNPEKEQSWRYHASCLQTVLQSYCNQNSMVLTQKYAHRSMELNREPRNEPTLI